MKNAEKYQRQYFMPLEATYDWVQKDYINEAPQWCSVDLRDGNQALCEPMSLEEKLEFFNMLVDIGMKEIEVGFPAASDTEYNFLRALIEKNMIPEDVTVQVLTQAREHIIKKTFEALEGVPHAIVHLYNSTSVAQREQVFKKSKEEILNLAVDGAKLLNKLAKETEGDFTFEYSPESFHGTEIDYTLEVCNAILDVWKPTKNHKAIINIPTTVQVAMPHVFATQVEYIHKHLKYRDSVILSVHPHNDRGSGVSDAELSMLAGAQRVEGTLFGNGERTGNVDLVTVAMNLYTHGVDPELDFSNIREIRDKYEKLTGMQVHERTPYAGDLVFTAFSGSHQDAIAKGMAWWDEGKSSGNWTVPYLPIDPRDVGREYESDVIRINSQSGKGGVAYILKQNYGLSIPYKMREDVGYMMKGISDRQHKELKPNFIYQIFEENYINKASVFSIPEFHYKQVDGITATVTIRYGDDEKKIIASGNGRLDAVSNAIKQYFGASYEVSSYEEHALSTGSSSKAVAYVGICSNDVMYWGVGIDEDIIKASVNALVSATNKLVEIRKMPQAKEQRIVDIMNYIQKNYSRVTMDDLSKVFFLSKPYLSKYIKDNTGMTFQDVVMNARMNKACSLLKNDNSSIELVAEKVGYQSVEHFNRLFKRIYDMTPMEYRKQKAGAIELINISIL
ncbi:2-isopropylmalate synthase [Clostridium cavendishii DSM 21758]|uniref:2-isopropylmalate synthase n=1 Tax=Clostridium cavendishii DSM 21758 TaxID=1121302 RepID=A0A1M6GRU9_9CLOT|nr:2-isopropylmalate synthase [Clostridium cavendishii]SHJ12576.1 2-isopropylmalate synthase [Clostridium cavendishii DSM 21758]